MPGVRTAGGVRQHPRLPRCHARRACAVTPCRQLLGHDPDNGIYGDCMRTSIAALLDLPPQEVPHFFEGGASAADGWKLIDEFLAARGLLLHAFSFKVDSVKEVLDAMKV